MNQITPFSQFKRRNQFSFKQRKFSFNGFSFILSRIRIYAVRGSKNNLIKLFKNVFVPKKLSTNGEKKLCHEGSKQPILC